METNLEKAIRIIKAAIHDGEAHAVLGTVYQLLTEIPACASTMPNNSPPVSTIEEFNEPTMKLRKM